MEIFYSMLTFFMDGNMISVMKLAKKIFLATAAFGFLAMSCGGGKTLESIYRS